MPAGFNNGTTMFADNVSFDGTDSPGKVTTDGQLLIGSAVAPNIRVSTLTAGSGVSITNGAGSITIGLSGGASIGTINGDSGSVTGSTVTIYSNRAGTNAGATVGFDNSGTTSTLNVSNGATANTLIGLSCGNATLTGIANTGLGRSCMSVLTNGQQNTAMGNGCLNACTSGGGNTVMGYLALASATGGSQNTAIGWSSLSSCNANNNTAIGFQTLASLTTGASNIAIGQGTGGSCSGASSGNILIDNAGAAESNTIRIGNVQTRCFIKGISGVTVAASVAVLIDANGQMGTILSSERYKENIHNVPKDLSILNLRPVSFNYKSDESKATQYGLIAEEVAKDFPYLCIHKDGQPETVKYHELCVFLLAEIQRLEKRVNTLEAK